MTQSIKTQKLSSIKCLATWLFLLAEPQGEEGETGNLDNLEPNSWKITDGSAGPTHTGDENTIVIIDESEGTISWDESSDDLAVLLELDSDGLSDGRVWLLSFDGNLTDNNTGSHGNTLEWGLVDGGALPLTEALHGPKVVSVRNTQFTGCLPTACLGFAHPKKAKLPNRVEGLQFPDQITI